MSKIGHNKPPKERKIHWKSISLNVWVYKDLIRIKDFIQKQRDALNPELKKQRVTIPMAIDIIAGLYWRDNMLPMEVIEIEEGIDIYKQIIKAHETKKPTK